MPFLRHVSSSPPAIRQSRDTGKLPFQGDALGAIVLSICVEPTPIPSEIGPVPPGFDRWCERALARDPELRFQSVPEAMAELEALGETRATAPSAETLRPAIPLAIELGSIPSPRGSADVPRQPAQAERRRPDAKRDPEQRLQAVAKTPADSGSRGDAQVSDPSARTLSDAPISFVPELEDDPGPRPARLAAALDQRGGCALLPVSKRKAPRKWPRLLAMASAAVVGGGLLLAVVPGWTTGKTSSMAGPGLWTAFQKATGLRPKWAGLRGESARSRVGRPGKWRARGDLLPSRRGT